MLRLLLLLALSIVGSAALFACGNSAEPEIEGVITRDQFIEAYIELRFSALRNQDEQILAEDRERILAGRGLTPEDLLEFVDAHGRNIEFMQEVWDEVERGMEERRGQEGSERTNT